MHQKECARVKKKKCGEMNNENVTSNYERDKGMQWFVIGQPCFPPPKLKYFPSPLQLLHGSLGSFTSGSCRRWRNMWRHPSYHRFPYNTRNAQGSQLPSHPDKNTPSFLPLQRSASRLSMPAVTVNMMRKLIAREFCSGQGLFEMRERMIKLITRQMENSGVDVSIWHDIPPRGCFWWW